MEKLKEYFQNKKIDIVLDIGTGAGQFIDVIVNSISFAQLVGIDPGVEWLEEAKQKFEQKNFTFLQMGAENMDFEDNSFDMVTMSKALHHLSNKEASFNEIKRVLKPNGWLVIAEMFSDNLNAAEKTQKFLHHTKSEIDTLLGNYHHATWEKKEIIEIIEENGFEVENHFENPFPKNKVQSEEDIEFWVKKMKDKVEKLNGMPEYNLYFSRIEEFRLIISKYGLQSPTNIVAICRSET